MIFKTISAAKIRVKTWEEEEEIHYKVTEKKKILQGWPSQSGTVPPYSLYSSINLPCHLYKSCLWKWVSCQGAQEPWNRYSLQCKSWLWDQRMDPKLQISPSLWLISRMGYNSILDTFEQNVYKLKGISALTPAILNEKKKKRKVTLVILIGISLYE